MLRPEIIQAAIDLADELDRRNLGVIAQPGTELADLVSLSTVKFNQDGNIPFVNNPDEADRGWKPDVEEIVRDSSVSVRDPEGGKPLAVPHTELLEHLVVENSDAVASHLNFARNVVMPAIREFHTRVSTALSSIPTTATYNPTIIKRDLPEPLKTPMLLDAVAEYRGGLVSPINARPGAPALSGAEVLELMSSGNAALDGELAIWSLRLGEDFFRKVWANAFVNEGIDGVPAGTFTSLVEDPVNGVDAALAVFMMARRAIDNPPQGTQTTLENWRKLVGDLLVQAAIRLNHGIEEYQRSKDVQQLVIRVGANGESIDVNADVYAKFIADGFNDAMLFGAVLSGERRYYVPGIVEKASEYVRIWERQNRMLSAAVVNRRYSEAQSLVIFKLEELLAENLQNYFPQEGEQGEVMTSINNARILKIIADVREYISNLDADQLEDLWKVSTNVIARLVFFHTNAYEILNGINVAFAANPDIDPMEAAFLSSVEYVTDYVFEQMTVVDL